MSVVAGEARLLGFGTNRAEADFERLYRRHAEDVFRYALLVLRSRPDAEDVTQATFIRAYRAIQRGERVRKPQHWLVKIAHRECLRHLRSASRRAVEVELDTSIAEAPEHEEGPSAEEIRVALSQLSFNQRAALVMRELEDRSYTEIAEVLNVSVSAIETLLFRARRALREQMEGPLQCGEVEGLLSKQLDGELGADEKRRLRAHTRSCAECSTLERRQRGRRAALKRLGAMITLPTNLGSFFGGGAGAIATGAAAIGLGAKAAAVVTAAAAATSIGIGVATHDTRAQTLRGLPVPDSVAALGFRQARATSSSASAAAPAATQLFSGASVRSGAPAAKVGVPHAAPAARVTPSAPVVSGSAVHDAPPAQRSAIRGAVTTVTSTVASAPAPLPVQTPTVQVPPVQTPTLPTPTVQTPTVQTPTVQTPTLPTPTVSTPTITTPVQAPTVTTQ